MIHTVLAIMLLLPSTSKLGWTGGCTASNLMTLAFSEIWVRNISSRELWWDGNWNTQVSRRWIPFLPCSPAGAGKCYRCTEGLKCLGIVSQRPSASIPHLSWNLALLWTFSAMWSILSTLRWKSTGNCGVTALRYHGECAVFSLTFRFHVLFVWEL